MKKLMTLSSLGIALAVLLAASLVTQPAEVAAKAKVVAIQGMGYDVNASLNDNLKSLVGKRVGVTLDSGKTFTGLVKAVGNHFLHLEKLDGKEFFDALIRIEDISTVDARFRDFER